jgi:hypothetical protein
MQRDEFYDFMCARFSNSFQNWDVTEAPNKKPQSFYTEEALR